MKIGRKVKSWVEEVSGYKFLYFLLLLIIIGAFLVRVYRTNDLLGLYYDQGRDALVIWKLWHEGKFFLIGPVTGLAGIFLGPFYYYLIAPFYLLGQGDPVVPAIFLASLSTIPIFLLYFLGKKMHSHEAGIIAAILGGFSYHVVTFSRWLSNPNPILLTSLLFLWSLWEITNKGSKYWWIAAALFAGISLQFESASAFFYIPILAIFFIWQICPPFGEIKNFPGFKIFFASVGAFWATLLPQIIFNFRHENILLINFVKHFFYGKGFAPMTKFMLEVRSEFFWNVFSQKIFPEWSGYAAIFLILLGFVFFTTRKDLKRPLLPLFMIFLLIPMLGYLFFQGNYNVVYDYYLSGYYLPFLLLLSVGMGQLWKTKTGVLLVGIFLAMFLFHNGTLLKHYLTDRVDGPTDISFPAQLFAISWIFENAKGEEFNVDVYVPPVIPYAYDYLFLWQGTQRSSQDRLGCEKNLCGMVDERVPLLYTLYEQDPPHPERLEAWLARQAGIGRIEDESTFAGITVQRRLRL